METTTFTALAERAGRWWTVRIPQIEGLAVQVRSLEQAEMMARRHIAEVLRVPPESVRVELRTESTMLPAVSQALQARQVAARAAEAAARATHAAIEALLAEGAPFQEAAVVLGLTPQEITELAPRSLGGPAMGGPGARSGAGAASRPAGNSISAGNSAPAGSRGPGAGGGSGRRGGPTPHRGPEVERPVGPGGLPQRTPSSGPMPAHH